MTDIKQPRAFTIEHEYIIDRIKTQCGIYKEYDTDFNQNDSNTPIHSCIALWDTGASRSVISTDVVQALNLESDGKTRVFHAGGESIVYTYLINIILPNNMGTYLLEVMECKLTGIDVLIGMDIISKGDFCITSPQGKTKFSFQVPPTHDFDFVKECNQ